MAEKELLNFTGFLKLFKRRVLPVSSLNDRKRKSRSPLKKTEPNTPK